MSRETHSRIVLVAITFSLAAAVARADDLNVTSWELHTKATSSLGTQDIGQATVVTPSFMQSDLAAPGAGTAAEGAYDFLIANCGGSFIFNFSHDASDHPNVDLASNTGTLQFQIDPASHLTYDITGSCFGNNNYFASGSTFSHFEVSLFDVTDNAYVFQNILEVTQDCNTAFEPDVSYVLGEPNPNPGPGSVDVLTGSLAGPLVAGHVYEFRYDVRLGNACEGSAAFAFAHLDFQVRAQSTLAITCPPDVQIECSDFYTAGDTGWATFEGGCDPDTAFVSYQDAIIDGTCPDSFTIERTWTVSDRFCFSRSCTQVIQVRDTTPPDLAYCPADRIVASGEPIPAPAEVSATDHCDPDVSITFAETVTPGACGGGSTIERVWTATDRCGNSSTCTQTVTVEGTGGGGTPTIACPPHRQLRCGESTDPANTGTATASDGNGGSLPVTYSDVSTPAGCAGRAGIDRTWTATDACGNPVSCVQHITFVDTTRPTITCPSDIQLGPCDSTDPASTGTATATDDCGSHPIITYSDQAAGGCTGRDIDRTWIATDPCGNAETCVQHIRFVDTSAPVFTICPEDEDLGNLPDPGELPTCESVRGMAQAQDDCPGEIQIDCVQADVDDSCVHRRTFTLIASDRCGNASDPCIVAYIWKNDNDGPVFTSCPVGRHLGCNPTELPNCHNTTATAIDGACEPPTVSCAEGPDTVDGCLFSRTLTFTAQDAVGHTTTCDATFTWTEDTASPVFTTMPADVDLGCNPADVTTRDPSVAAIDNCGIVSITSDFADSGDQCHHSRTITYTATDGCGNTATHVQRILWTTDSTGPTLTCPAPISVQCASAIPPPNPALVTASDACGSVSVVFLRDEEVPGSRTCPNRFSIARTYQGTDACGNVSACTQSITVNDATAPVIVCPPDRQLQCSSSANPAQTGYATATDGCGGSPTITYSDAAAGGCTGRDIIRTWTATDLCGNSASCVQRLTFQDTTPPVITACPSGGFVGYNPAEASLPTCESVKPQVQTNDNCGGTAVLSCDQADSTTDCLHSRTITIVARDGCGNASSPCTVVFTWVVDTEGPTFSNCPTSQDLGCNPLSRPTCANTTATAVDGACGVPTVTCAQSPDSNSGCVYSRTLTFTATDDAGNTATCSATYTWTDDTTRPTFTTCPSDRDLGCNPSSVPTCDPTVAATDNCGNATVTCSYVDTGNSCIHTRTITYTARDGCGNTGTNTCVQRITWRTDTTGPTLACPGSITVSCAGAVPAPNPALVTASDGCGGSVVVTFAQDQEAPGSRTCANRYTILRTYRGTDACGNVSTCTQTITVNDTTPPVLVCPGDRQLSCCDSTDPGQTGAATATDNCGGSPVITYTDAVTNNGIDRTWTARDACGNTATCVQRLRTGDCRITGGGSIIPTPYGRITHGFELHCNVNNLPNNLEVNYGSKPENNFHLEVLTTATCFYDPAVGPPNPPRAGCNTIVGTGVGRFNGVNGFTIEFTFTDGGEPGTNDRAVYLIRNPGGGIVMQASGYLNKGNQQFHGN